MDVCGWLFLESVSQSADTGGEGGAAVFKMMICGVHVMVDGWYVGGWWMGISGCFFWMRASRPGIHTAIFPSSQPAIRKMKVHARGAFGEGVQFRVVGVGGLMSGGACFFGRRLDGRLGSDG